MKGRRGEERGGEGGRRGERGYESRWVQVDVDIHL